MATRSLNKVQLIGNLTRDPELRYTPSGTPVCSFGLATNRSWMPSGSEERQEETEFHNIVAWSKLAELCAQLLSKGRKIYIEGRLQTRSWETPEGEKRTKTEVVAEDMIILDNRPKIAAVEGAEAAPVVEEKRVEVEPLDSSVQENEPEEATTKKKAEVKGKKESTSTPKPAKEEKKPEEKEDIDLDKIPF